MSLRSASFVTEAISGARIASPSFGFLARNDGSLSAKRCTLYAMNKLTHEEILKLRQANGNRPRSPIVILLNDVRSIYNVGAIFRIADGIRAEKIFLCGITGKPPHRSLTKTALGAEAFVPWEYRASALDTICELQSKKYSIVALEHTSGSVHFKRGDFRFPACLVLGNEVTGVDAGLLDRADMALEIPMLGSKNSLNVSVAAGVVLYEMLEAAETPSYVSSRR